MANRERKKRFVDFMEDVQYNIFWYISGSQTTGVNLSFGFCVY